MREPVATSPRHNQNSQKALCSNRRPKTNRITTTTMAAKTTTNLAAITTPSLAMREPVATSPPSISEHTMPVDYEGSGELTGAKMLIRSRKCAHLDIHNV